MSQMKGGKSAKDREAQMKKYMKYEQKLNIYMDNIAGIGQLAGVQLEFLKDIKKQIFKVQQAVEEVKEVLMEVKDDIGLLRGKSIYQMLNIRRKNILQLQKDRKFNQIYIELIASYNRNRQSFEDQSIPIVPISQEPTQDDPHFEIPIQELINEEEVEDYGLEIQPEQPVIEEYKQNLDSRQGSLVDDQIIQGLQGGNNM